MRYYFVSLGTFGHIWPVEFLPQHTVTLCCQTAPDSIFHSPDIVIIHNESTFKEFLYSTDLTWIIMHMESFSSTTSTIDESTTSSSAFVGSTTTYLSSTTPQQTARGFFNNLTGRIASAYFTYYWHTQRTRDTKIRYSP